MDRFGLPDKQNDWVQAQGLVLVPLDFVPKPGLINWNLITQQNAEVTLTASANLAFPVGIRKGRLYMLEIIQAGAGSFTLTLNAAYKNASTITLQTAAGSSNIITWKAITDTTLSVIGNYTSTRA